MIIDYKIIGYRGLYYLYTGDDHNNHNYGFEARFRWVFVKPGNAWAKPTSFVFSSPAPIDLRFCWSSPNLSGISTFHRVKKSNGILAFTSKPLSWPKIIKIGKTRKNPGTSMKANEHSRVLTNLHLFFVHLAPHWGKWSSRWSRMRPWVAAREAAFGWPWEVHCLVPSGGWSHLHAL